MQGIKKLREFYKKNINEPDAANLIKDINEKEKDERMRRVKVIETTAQFEEQMRRRPIWSIQNGPQGPGRIIPGNDQDEQDLRKEKEQQTGETGEP